MARLVAIRLAPMRFFCSCQDHQPATAAITSEALPARMARQRIKPRNDMFGKLRLARVAFVASVRARCRHTDREVSRTSGANFDWIIERFSGCIARSRESPSSRCLGGHQELDKRTTGLPPCNSVLGANGTT